VSFDLELTGRRALVTAGTKGIGAAVVEVLHNAGATVVATARAIPADAHTGVHYILCDGETFSVDASWFAAERSKSQVRAMTLASDLSAHEKTVIERALRQASGRVSGASGAAAILGMPRQTLESKLKKLGIRPYHFRAP
jgi:NAD(P)-dependent dehydrogenase (short-subunit alcohol dehydrogenase family)